MPASRTWRISSSDRVSRSTPSSQTSPALDPAGRLDHAQDGQRHGGLAGAGLADQAEALAGVEAKADVVGGSHRAARVS